MAKTMTARKARALAKSGVCPGCLLSRPLVRILGFDFCSEACFRRCFERERDLALGRLATN